ncbi:unnamed protein product [Effrenium voratum]|nr:unnamed protein product [Effrenium voratum]
MVLPQLVAGAFPGDRQEPQHSAKVKTLTDLGVTTFVCLQERGELNRFTPYMSVARRLHKDPASLEFFHCPMPDGGTTSAEELNKAVATIVDRLLAGRTVYVHCWGGHGRTGTVIAAFLVTCYGLSRQQAEDFYNAGEQARKARQGYWPHSSSQRLGTKSWGNLSSFVAHRQASC